MDIIISTIIATQKFSKNNYKTPTECKPRPTDRRHKFYRKHIIEYLYSLGTKEKKIIITRLSLQ